jgi:hypothetical protein
MLEQRSAEKDCSSLSHRADRSDFTSPLYLMFRQASPPTPFSIPVTDAKPKSTSHQPSHRVSRSTGMSTGMICIGRGWLLQVSFHMLEDSCKLFRRSWQDDYTSATMPTAPDYDSCSATVSAGSAGVAECGGDYSNHQECGAEEELGRGHRTRRNTYCRGK